MTETTCLINSAGVCDSAIALEQTPERLPAAPTGDAPTGERVETAEGWQALALAVHGAPLTGTELAAAELLPTEVALDLLFPDLDDAARHEAIWALDTSA